MSDTDTLDDEVRPLLQLASTPEVVHGALELLQADEPAVLSRAKHEALFRRAVEKAHPKKVPLFVQGLAFVTACLIGAVAAVQLYEVTAVPEIEASPGAQYVLDGRVLTITAGHVVVEARRPIRVRAGQYEMVLTHSRVAFDVTERGAGFHVEFGEGVPNAQMLRGGVELPPPPAPALARVTLELPEAPSTSCGAGAESCLVALAEGDGLEAETALYELALTAHEHGQVRAALDKFLEHQRRFPDGVLAPEASIGVMLSHLALRDADAAAAEARRFVEKFPADPRAPRVRGLMP
ncbi:MAG: outer membrane protein assembly factor BamD [Myxococcaceae bacterium]|nr:outer membrane protein assembly factor BamD [Myxococcaceae bacterium]